MKTADAKQDHEPIKGNMGGDFDFNNFWRQILCQRLYFQGQITSGALRNCENISGWRWQWSEWDEYLYQVYEYVRINYFYPTHKSHLGEWITEQNHLYFHGKLLPLQVNYLTELPNWQWEEKSSSKKRWRENCQIFKKETLHFGYPPKKNKHYTKYSWWNHQRNRIANLSTDQKMDLADVNKLWHLSGNKYRWLKTFESLKHGEHVSIAWKSQQRLNYKKGRLSFDEIARLESITNWQWAPNESQTHKRIEELKEFVLLNERLPKNEEWFEDKKIGSWCAGRRMSYKKNLLTQAQIDELESIKLWTWVQEDIWMPEYLKLETFVKVNKRLPAKQDELRPWLDRQLLSNKSGTLSIEKKERLESLPGWVWNRQEYLWSENFINLIKYINNHGDLPPKGHYLKTWCYKQRSNHRRNVIKSYRVKKLESIALWKW